MKYLFTFLFFIILSKQVFAQNEVKINYQDSITRIDSLYVKELNMIKLQKMALDFGIRPLKERIEGAKSIKIEELEKLEKKYKRRRIDKEKYNSKKEFIKKSIYKLDSILDSHSKPMLKKIYSRQLILDSLKVRKEYFNKMIID